MCELLGMSAHQPASITLSLNEFARHGGETGPHADGWGVAYYQGPDANLIRESNAAADSVLMSTLRGYKVASEIVIAHIRRASFGPANFLYTDGDALFVHGHVRTQADNSICAPGLHYISVSCDYGIGQSDLASVKLESDQVQKVTLISTKPLNNGNWQPMHEGQLLVVRGGEVVN